MITRRCFVLGFATVLAAMNAKVSLAENHNQRISLWPDLPPGSGGPNGQIVTSAKGAVSNVSSPSLEVFAPDAPNGAAVIIAAGGGYKHIENGKEAYPAAKWLTDRGFYAFVLDYRLPIEGWSVAALAPLQDVQRAFRLVRARADEWQINPEKIGALGFSAGGHLMGLAATRPDFAAYEPLDEIDKQSARPDNAALIYPVITLEKPYDNTSTRRSLVGKTPTPNASREWSVESHVTEDCPPIFLTQAEDDQISNIANSLIMQRDSEAAGVSVEFHPIASGGHSFGMGKRGTPSEYWPQWYEEWLRKQGDVPR
ncbi:alpha/beta hydrolase [Brucella gallinifaecis]|uniref:alpha/beta hydrolase n=1 Tax=Brucella gallinifaecis TaxID=215590 RepID=UPI00235F93FD|nr:alpha/beta hydrolase [Brucella gallinifaecis]